MTGSTAQGPSFAFVADGRGGVTVMRDEQPQSHVDLSDPALLVFEYVQHLALAVALLPPGPLAVTHIGGAGLTLPRYVQHERPGSTQIVLEPDIALTEAVRRALPLPRGHRIRVRPLDGRTGIRGLRDDSADLVVVDAFDAGRVPAELTTTEAMGDYARVLRPAGLLALNVTDEPGRAYLARVLATVRAGFAHGALLATRDVLKGRRFGNAVVLASAAPIDLSALERAAAAAPLPTGVWGPAEITRVCRSARPLTPEDSLRSPGPPTVGQWRVR